MQDRMEEERMKERFSSEVKRIEDRELELKEYRTHLAMQERELEEFRIKLKHEQLEREKKFQRELESREEFFADRERKLFERQREVEEQLIRRQEETEQLRMKLGHEIVQREAQLNNAIQALEKEKVRYNEESRKKIESKSKDYVSDALDTLNEKERQFHFLSKIWSFVGALSLVFGVAFFGYITIVTFSSIPATITWEFITFSVFKGLISVSLYAALAKYAFMFSNSYMQEALKNGDRRHAINFGKFYLESYGAAAEWSQIKEAFEHWNIIGSNAFNKADTSQLDVTTLEKVAGAIEKIGKSVPGFNKNQDV